MERKVVYEDIPFTEFTPEWKDFSDKAFMEWYEGFGKMYFEIIDEPESEKIYNDMRLKIDVRLRSRANDRTLAVQYRFRNCDKSNYERYQQVTMTRLNGNTGINGEVYDNTSTHFLYGYVKDGKVFEWIMFELTRVLDAIHDGTIKIFDEHNPRKNQKFIAVDFEDIKNVSRGWVHHKGEDRQQGKN